MKPLALSLLATCIMLAVPGCATPSDAGRTLVFQQAGVRTITVTNRNVVIGTDKRFALNNCSTSEQYCMENKAEGFSLLLPKHCPGGSVTDLDARRKIWSVDPHTAHAVVSFQQEGHFLFELSARNEIAGLYYDGRKPFNYETDRSDNGNLRNYYYPRVSGEGLFPAC